MAKEHIKRRSVYDEADLVVGSTADSQRSDGSLVCEMLSERSRSKRKRSSDSPTKVAESVSPSLESSRIWRN